MRRSLRIIRNILLLAIAAVLILAGVLALNPLHAPGPALPQQASPYYPSSRCFRSRLRSR